MPIHYSGFGEQYRVEPRIKDECELSKEEQNSTISIGINPDLNAEKGVSQCLTEKGNIQWTL